MKNSKCRVILTRSLRLNDEVVMYMDPHARSVIYKGIEDGTKGVVTDFPLYDRYYGHIGNFGHKPGRYKMHGAAEITWETGEVTREGGTDLYWLDEAIHDIRVADKEHNEAFEKPIWVSELPELPLWEHDVVEIISDRVKQAWQIDYCRVDSIHWDYLDSKRNDGSPMPLYSMESLDGGRGTMSLDDTEVRLVARGDVWKWYNDRDSLKFESILDEARLHQQLHLYDRVRNPNTKNYKWYGFQCMEAAKAGLIDVMSFSSGFFGGRGMLFAIKFHDQDLGERMREKFIAEFTTNPINDQTDFEADALAFAELRKSGEVTEADGVA